MLLFSFIVDNRALKIMRKTGYFQNQVFAFRNKNKIISTYSDDVFTNVYNAAIYKIYIYSIILNSVQVF